MANPNVLNAIMGFAVILTLANARSFNMNLCDDKVFNCQCGIPGYSFPIAVQQCSAFYRWQPICRPCNREIESLVCTNYRNCLDCEQDKCSQCPAGKYGLWCTGVCQCQNNAECRKTDGRCICEPGFEGVHCERPITPTTSMATSFMATASMATAITCPVPEPIDNGDLEVRNGNYEEPQFGTRIKYSCHPDYIIVGTVLSRCTRHGNWSAPPPSCVNALNITSLFDFFNV